MLNKLKNKKFVFVVGLSLALAFGGIFCVCDIRTKR